MRMRPIFLLVLATALAGCGDILPKPLPPPALYRLTAAHDFPAGATTTRGVQLQIAAPSAEAALDSTRVALSRSPTSLDYFADAAWSDRLPLVLQARLRDSFDNAHRLVAMAGEDSAAQSDAILTLELRHFEADYSAAAAPQWRIELTANLIGTTDRKVMATRIFTATEPAAHNDVPSIIAAADQDWRNVAGQIVDWTVDTLSRPASSAPTRR